MALAHTLAVTLTGLEGQLVEVECGISAGLPGLSFTGLADAATNQAPRRGLWTPTVTPAPPLELPTA